MPCNLVGQAPQISVGPGPELAGFSLFSRFARLHHPQRDTTLAEPTVLAFLQSMVDERGTSGSLAGVAGYGRFLAATLERLGRPADGVRTFLLALNNKGALVPKTQAVPVTWDQLRAAKGRLPHRTWLATWLAWKAASRLGEVLQLTGANVIPGQDSSGFVVQWLQTTKAGRKRPFALCNLTEVICTPRDAEELRQILALRTNERLCPKTTPAVVRQYRTAGLRTTTGHSMKRGATLLLSQLAAKGLIDPALIPRLLKHKEAAPLLPDVTVRYGADKTAIARIGRTGELTRHL